MARIRFSVFGILVVLLVTPLALRGVTPAAADSPDRGDDSHQRDNGGGGSAPRVDIQATTFFDTRDAVEHDRASNHASRFGRTSSSNLINHGGPVVAGTAKVYLIFWGWTSDPLGSQSYINGFFGAANQSAWLKSVTQYSSATNAYSVQSLADSSAVPVRPSSNDIAVEAAKYALQFGGGGSNNLYVVFTPSKHSESGFATQWCGYHSAAQVVGGPRFAYASMPFQPDAGYACGAGSVDGNSNDGYSIVGGHELGEAITDVYLSAWWDRNGAENGDKCAWTNLTLVQLTGAKYAVQPLWSNAYNAGRGGCVLSYP